MGNEGSTFQPHSGVSRTELETLKKTFPANPTAKLWKPWTEVFLPAEIVKIEGIMKNKNNQLTFQSYQQIYGDIGKGNVDKRIDFLLRLAHTDSDTGSGPRSDISNTKTWLLAFKILSGAFCRCYNSSFKKASEEDFEKLALSLTHDLLHTNEKRKNTFKQEYAHVNVEASQVEKIFINTPLIEEMFTRVMGVCFQVKSPSSLSVLVPSIPPDTVTSLSILQAVFLNSHLPFDLRNVWRPLFNSDVDGESFSKFAGSITKQGPTIIVIWDKAGNIFGGFATESWKPSPKFVGKSESFLFHLSPELNVYHSTPFNTNYQYFNLKQKTLPNGLGMGGQLEYFGFWVDAEFGILQTSPSCSTFHSPQLGELQGKIDKIEVFGVGELKVEDDEVGASVLDMDPEAQAVMEMMGKTFHSKVIREVDQDQERKKELEQKFNESN